MFDPERVERFIVDTDGKVEPANASDRSAQYVLASDYDLLLGIHLRHVTMIAGLFEHCKEPLSEEKMASLKNGTWV
jgi:hypothetical protein